jgi:cytochrome P450
MKMISFHFFLYAQLIGLAIFLWLTYRIIQALSTRRANRRLARAWGCKPPARLKTIDPIFGIDFFRNSMKHIKQHTYLDFTQSTFAQMNVNTWTGQILTAPIIATQEPENVKALLATNFDHYGVEKIRETMTVFIGKGIFVVDGAAWQHSRSVLRPIFTRSQLTNFSILSTHATRLLDRIPLDGTTIDLQPLFFDLTLDVATHVLLGQSIDSQLANHQLEFVERYNRALHWFETGEEVEVFGISWSTSASRLFKKDCKFVQDYVSGLIDRASKDFDASKPETDRYILLESLLSQKLPHDQIRAEILSSLLAGRDTTASMLSDLWFELSRHPRIFAKLQSEIRLQPNMGRGLDFETIKSLQYLKATLNEVLRIHPVVPENGRLALCNTTLPLGGGTDGKSPVFIPKGTVVSWSTYCMHRRKDIWGEDADSFRPERWLDHVDDQGVEIKGVRPGWAYLPFNGGPRICIGQQFALLQASYVTIRLLQSISSLESRDPNPWTEKMGMTATGFHGCKVAMTAKAE